MATPVVITVVPEMGMILPEMGRTSSTTRSGLADALFTPVQQRVLGLLFGQPDRRFQSAELIRLAKGGVGAVHRQLGRLAEAELVTVTRTGNQKHYQARRDSPVFEDLHQLIVKTVGVAEPLRQALARKARAIRAAFVYGSVAKGTKRAGSDIDLLVISTPCGTRISSSPAGGRGRARADHQPDRDDGRPVARKASRQGLVRGQGRGPDAGLRGRIRR